MTNVIAVGKSSLINEGGRKVGVGVVASAAATAADVYTDTRRCHSER